MTSEIAHPPETLEGWYALHQIFRARESSRKNRSDFIEDLARTALSAVNAELASKGGGVDSTSSRSGWTCAVRLIGSSSDLMLVHFGDSLDAIGRAQDCVLETVLGEMEVAYSFLSVTEAGLYHVTAQLARDAQKRGGTVGDEEYVRALRSRADEERNSPHVTRRLYPELPADMPYVCFYPMSKKRDAGQNWYGLSLDDRSRLMQTHGATGRRYAGRVQQIITGAIGFDSWEWGVTLFARDPLDFKKLVTDMRFDEVSAQYAEFGDFFVGKLVGA
ncbi:MAG TPA: chlorite dismutase family protein [Gemmatimonadaceae bacterium]